MPKYLSLFLALTAGLVLSLACSGNGNDGRGSSTAGFPMSIQQTDGQTLVLERPPQRIVSLSAHATEIFCTLGAGQQIVAVERFENCPSGSGAKPQLDAFTPNLEAIAGYQPDLVFVTYDAGDLVASLRRLGMAVLYIDVPDTLDGTLEHIETLGRAVGKADEARELVRSMRQRLDQARQKVNDVSQGPRVFHELDSTYYTVAPNSFVGSLYTLLKAQNIAQGAASAFPQLSAEVIVQRNPQVIVLADEAGGVTAATVRARPGWDAIDAVRNNRICSVDPDIISRPGPRIVDAVEALGKCLYPERF